MDFKPSQLRVLLAVVESGNIVDAATHLTTLIELDPSGTSVEVVDSMIDYVPVTEGNGPLIDQFFGSPHSYQLTVTMLPEDPPLPLPRLRARGQVTEIRVRDLRFTAPEARPALPSDSRPLQRSRPGSPGHGPADHRPPGARIRCAGT